MRDTAFVYSVEQLFYYGKNDTNTSLLYYTKSTDGKVIQITTRRCTNSLQGLEMR